jgi:hypothetical protein
MFKQFAWLGSAAIGAIAILVRLEVLEVSTHLYIAFGAIAISILASIFAQINLVSLLGQGKTVYEQQLVLRIHLIISLLALGFGVGSALP